jgi:hypothetical protein
MWRPPAMVVIFGKTVQEEKTCGSHSIATSTHHVRQPSVVLTSIVSCLSASRRTVGFLESRSSPWSAVQTGP